MVQKDWEAVKAAFAAAPESTWIEFKAGELTEDAQQRLWLADPVSHIDWLNKQSSTRDLVTAGVEILNILLRIILVDSGDSYEAVRRKGFAERIDRVRRRDLINDDRAALLHKLREARNDFSHNPLLTEVQHSGPAMAIANIVLDQQKVDVSPRGAFHMMLRVAAFPLKTICDDLRARR